MSDLKPGDIVNVSIKGVRVGGTVTAISIVDEQGIQYLMPPQAAIERVAPSEWPPQQGDVWGDGKGEIWFTVRSRDRSELLMVPSYMDPDPWGEYWKRPDVLLAEHQGSLKLLNREGPPF